MGDNNFRINVETSHPDFGPLRDGDTPRYGSVFLISEESIVPLTKEQTELFDAAKGEEIDWNKLEERMAYLAKTRDAALKAGAKIDGYLENEDYRFQSEAAIGLQEDSFNEMPYQAK